VCLEWTIAPRARALARRTLRLCAMHFLFFPHFIRARKHQSKMVPLSLEDQLKNCDTVPSMKTVPLINESKRYAKMQLKVETLSPSQLKLWGKFLQMLNVAMERKHDTTLKEKLKEKDDEIRELEREKASLQKQVNDKTTITEINYFEKHLQQVIKDPAFVRHCLHRVPFPATKVSHFEFHCCPTF